MTGPPLPVPDVVRPADARELETIVREAVAERRALRLVGAGGWLDAGRPVHAARHVALDRLRGVVEYVPGDLTLTARAGTPLAELQQVVAAEGQWLPLEPWGGDAGTLGATLATATAGPTAGAVGLPRDVALGVVCVTGSGELVRGGGRVVKNVAGFDLVRLMVGAWGTLGALTEATVRLRARPEADVTLALALPDDGALAAWLGRLRALPLAPLALELLSAPLARRLALGDAPHGLLLARLAGNAPAVAAQQAALAALGDTAPVPGEAWTRLRTAGAADAADAVVARVSAAPARIHECWRAAHRTAAALDARLPHGGALVHASVQRGVARLVAPAAAPHAAAVHHAFAAAERGLTWLFERLPAALWPALAPSPARTPLAEGVRHAFDPARLLNPGIFGETAAGPPSASTAAPLPAREQVTS